MANLHVVQHGKQVAQVWHQESGQRLMLVEHSGGPDLDVARIEAQPGTYALVLSAKASPLVRIGRLGGLRLQPGFYVYIGSALGPGGVRARLAHHFNTSERPHWHIDYLRAHAEVEEVWYCHGRMRWEHEWAHHIGMKRGASVPLADFGASDCGCDSHLYFFQSRPSRDGFVRSLRACGRKHPPVRLLRIMWARR